MLEIIKVYPLIFIFTVILPVIGGLVGGYIGWDSLKSRHEDRIHKRDLQNSINAIDEKLGPITTQIAVIERYEKELLLHNKKDEVLSSVLTQYKQMKKATEQFKRFRGVDNESDRGMLAEYILETITDSLTPVFEAQNIASRPLIIGLGPNHFKVVFSVPMRVAPKLEFQRIPAGVTAQVSEHTKFGFVVHFFPVDVPVRNFGFTADAEL